MENSEQTRAEISNVALVRSRIDYSKSLFFPALLLSILVLCLSASITILS